MTNCFDTLVVVFAIVGGGKLVEFRCVLLCFMKDCTILIKTNEDHSNLFSMS